MRVWRTPLLAGVVAALAGCSSLGTGQPTHITVPSTVTAQTSPAVPPSTISIPKLGITAATMVPLGLNPDKTLQVPDVHHPKTIGWYSGGVIPGKIGPAIVVSHVDGAGQAGAFAKLKTMVVGDTVNVTRVDGKQLVFKVKTVESVPKNNFPVSEYQNTPDPELLLITCTGSWVGGSLGYADNEIVRAVLVT